MFIPHLLLMLLGLIVFSPITRCGVRAAKSTGSCDEPKTYQPPPF
ncbi:hypothetical protein AA0119_g8173 [Alternaria tenuissima]|uniref:Uncharacterized protein n=1 Tax=Alternaria tenuissima TaxID=119927 RepID=A0ABY0G3B4_9PLEO|nr:hypothetical protein AA0119_g8173 [Alternaria tenuissima]